MMSITGWLAEKLGYVKAQEPIKKTAGFMAAEAAGTPDRRPDRERVADYGLFIDTFRALPWLYAAGTALAIAATKPELKWYREIKEGGEVHQEAVQGEAINQLCELPNPNLSWRELIQITVINLSLTGNAYWNLVGTKEDAPIGPSNPPVEIWWVKPAQIQPLPDEAGNIVQYEFTGPTGQVKRLDQSEIIHFRLPNPGSYFLGMGMMEPLTSTATLEANSVAFMKNFMENDATPPFVFVHPGTPEKPERDRFYKAWDERHRGSKKTNRGGMIWGGMKIEKIADGTIKDIQYPELRKMNREEMLAAAGVPPSVVGLLEYANYSNMEVQQQKFWEDSVIPILGIIADKATIRLAPIFDPQLWAEFDYSNIKVLQEDDERRARIASLLISAGMRTPNQMAAQYFNAEPYEGGDSYYMTMSLVPIGEDPGAKARAQKRLARAEGRARRKTEAQEDPAEKPAGSFWTSEERRKALWTAFEKRVGSAERAFVPEVESYLKAQAASIKEKALRAGSTAELQGLDLLDVHAEMLAFADKYEGRYLWAFERAGNAGYKATKGMIWIAPEERKIKDQDEFRMSPEHKAKIRQQIEKSAVYFNETTFSVVAAEIAQAIEDEMTVEEAAQEIWESLINRLPWEARRIARTEMARTENFGGLAGYKQNENIELKGWLCSFVPASRDEHMSADGQEVPLDDAFIVGGEQLDYPGDHAGSAGNVINCLCTTYPVVGEI